MKKKNFTNLNINPCKMCMPMGGVMALKGIESSMVIIHGSQGCSTYMRRHMATHYNEPIDIASSSLSEKGTVYGGAENLKTGIVNMLKLYNPKLVGVLTTCLAETIGEDIKRIAKELKDEEPLLKDVKLVPIATPGYGGTQFEGFYHTLKTLVEELGVDLTPNGKINIIASTLNPGDIRHIKEILKDFSINCTILPDISETLDAPFKSTYDRIPAGGTKIEDIEKMPGAAATIEMGVSLEDKYSPGAYLKDKFGVPLYRCSLPVGLEGTDEFMELLSKLSGRKIPEKYLKERGRYLDAIIDAHKFNGEARAVIYGEPELSLSLTKVCFEAGIVPVLIAIGTSSPKAGELIKKYSEKYPQKPLIIDETDFETIEKYALEFKANMMLGNSDGRRIEERNRIKLVRVGFPVHDRLGGQRKVTVGYSGAINLIEETANTILESKETEYRKEMFDKFYKEEPEKSIKKYEAVPKTVNTDSITIEQKTESHPCYNAGAHKYARMHIPVAPKCNISCNYCSRRYDCCNESRPGVTSEVLTPEQAFEKFKEVKKKIPNLTVVGIAGPGDALANFEETRKSIELIRNEFPDITFCLSTNGLMLPFYAEELIKLGITHVTITINTIDPKIGAKLYRNINYLGENLPGEEGAAILLQNQLSGLKYLSKRNIMCKVNIVMVKGVNDTHIPEVVKKVKACGAFVTNIMQMIPAQGSVFESMPLVSQKELFEMRKICEVDMKQMYHCRQCRADAIGMLSQDRSLEFRCSCNGDKEEHPASTGGKYKVAIASKGGLNIDQHFGHATEFYIYGYDNGVMSFLEMRNVEKYCSGPGECDEQDDKIERIIKTISDCQIVLAMRAGTEPVRKLEKRGIKLFQMYESILKGIEKGVSMLEQAKVS